MIYQQGDVLVQKVRSIPEEAVEVRRGRRGFVLAEGEVTGHAHRVKDEIRLYRGEDGMMYLKADNPFTLLHEEHKSIRFTPGVYKAWKVREYDHIEEAIRQVAD